MIKNVIPIKSANTVPPHRDLQLHVFIGSASVLYHLNFPVVLQRKYFDAQRFCVYMFKNTVLSLYNYWEQQDLISFVIHTANPTGIHFTQYISIFKLKALILWYFSLACANTYALESHAFMIGPEIYTHKISISTERNWQFLHLNSKLASTFLKWNNKPYKSSNWDILAYLQNTGFPCFCLSVTWKILYLLSCLWYLK